MSRPIRFDDVRTWIFETALPFWATNALDPNGFGFLEQLDLQGRPRDPGFKRLRTQARQTYVFCHAHLLGWPGPALEIAEAGHGALLGTEMAPGGFPKTLSADGRVLDDTFDLYDQAFALHAMAWWARATRDLEHTKAAHRLMDAISFRLGGPGHGFRSADPDTGERLQNPHMHLLEASLAWVETSGDSRFKALADRIVDMHLALFQQGDDGVLAEVFDADWRPVEGRRGRVVEPGHQYEWAWLLGKAGALLDRDLEAPARRLHGYARRLGHNPATGLCWDCIDRDGTVRKPTSRSWAQTEWLKAELALGEHWGGFDRDRIAEAVNLLLDKHLAWSPAGTWMDCFDAEGRPIADHVPASILYHVFLAFAELLRLEDRIAAS
jgi:mannose/cellobiose epimerase-like protein (N-acyl-D-glucosamine 2-epimerase family)